MKQRFYTMTLLFCGGLAILSCAHKTRVDLLVKNAVIYTVDSAFGKATAMVISNGKVTATGSDAYISQYYEAAETIDADGKYIYPGFIDAHAHFVAYGLGLQTVNLAGTQSWEEVVQRVAAAAKATDSAAWLIGRGWDQNDWPKKVFPSNEALNQLFPDRPVILTRIDGHAAIVNQKALDMAGIHTGDKIKGGDIEMRAPGPEDSFLPRLSGILVDNAVDLVSNKIPPASIAQVKAALQKAQTNCFAAGLTTIDDCGLDYEAINIIDSLQKTGDLQMRLYAMLSDNPKNIDYALAKGKIKTDRLNVRAFKVYADGALGSRGACLLQPYIDKPRWSGFLLSPAGHFDSVATVIYKMGFQMCTHAIGDSGNRVVLQTYGRQLKAKNDLRWRIEHAQVVDQHDIALFGEYSVIPSVQPTHATSDMYWAAERLGPERVKNAYAYHDLLQQNGWLPLGTDFPVEDISPFKTFYAAVVRKDARDWPNGGFQMNNALSREDALRGMTIWAARANFEELEKGSLEKNKWADFVILDQDLLQTAPGKLLSTKVLGTFINGKKVFGQ
jgi:predicted amidohydrolase YtcJ